MLPPKLGTTPQQRQKAEPENTRGDAMTANLDRGSCNAVHTACAARNNWIHPKLFQIKICVTLQNNLQFSHELLGRPAVILSSIAAVADPGPVQSYNIIPSLTYVLLEAYLGNQITFQSSCTDLLVLFVLQ